MQKYITLIIWILLISLTLFAYFASIKSLLLLSTFIKGKLVLDYFMGYAKMPKRWKNFPTIWLGVVLGVVWILG